MDQVGFFFVFFDNANLSYFIRWAKRLRVRFFHGERQGIWAAEALSWG